MADRVSHLEEGPPLLVLVAHFSVELQGLFERGLRGLELAHVPHVRRIETEDVGRLRRIARPLLGDPPRLVERPARALEV